MKWCLSGIFTLALVGCANQSVTQITSTYDTLDKLSEEQWQAHKDTRIYNDFNTDWLLFNNANKIDYRGDCYSIEGGEEYIILVQNAEGVIQYAVPKRSTLRSECFVRAFIGVEYPKPPFAPFYHTMRMSKNR